MTLPEYLELCEYWSVWPPQHESLALLLGAYTDWEPAQKPIEEMTPEERAKREAAMTVEHRRSLERRWKAGSMNPEQLFKAWGGQILDQTEAQTIQSPRDRGSQPLVVSDGTMPGIGAFPGSPAWQRQEAEKAKRALSGK